MTSETVSDWRRASIAGATLRPSATFPRGGIQIVDDSHLAAPPDFVRRTLMVIALGSLALAIWLLLWNALEVFLLAFVALLLAVALATPASALASRTRVPHWLALALVALTLVVLIAVGAWFLGDALLEQVRGFINDLPQIIERLQSTLQRLPGGVEALETIDEIEPLALADLGMVAQATGALAGTVEFGIRIVFVIFLALFLAAAPSRYREGVVRLVPPKGQPRAKEVFAELTVTIQGWVLGQLASMLLIGILATVGLFVIGVQYALLLGLFAGLAELIPIFGPLIAWVPAVLVAFAEAPQQALWVTALYLVIQQLEGNAIQPMVQRFAVHLPQALTVMAVLTGGVLFGPIGLFIGTPLIAIILVLIKMLYLHDVHGQSIELPGGRSEE